MKSRRKALVGLALLALLAIGATVPALAQDATTDQSTEDPATDQPTEDATTTPLERAAERQTAFAEALAAELGLDTDTVAAAIEKVQADLAEQHRAEHLARLQERLDAAVEAGTLTQEQADALREAAESGALGGFGGRLFGGRGFGGPGGGPHGGRGWGFGLPFSDDTTPDADATSTSV